MVDGHQDLVGYGYCGALVTSSSFESVKFVSQVSTFGFGRGVGGLHECRLQIDIALGNATTSALTGRFIVARTNSRSGGQLRNILEHTHVYAQFGDDRPGQRRIHAGDFIQQRDFCRVRL